MVRLSGTCVRNTTSAMPTSVERCSFTWSQSTCQARKGRSNSRCRPKAATSESISGTVSTAISRYCSADGGFLNTAKWLRSAAWVPAASTIDSTMDAASISTISRRRANCRLKSMGTRGAAGA